MSFKTSTTKWNKKCVTIKRHHLDWSQEPSDQIFEASFLFLFFYFWCLTHISVVTRTVKSLIFCMQCVYLEGSQLYNWPHVAVGFSPPGATVPTSCTVSTDRRSSVSTLTTPYVRPCMDRTPRPGGWLLSSTGLNTTHTWNIVHLRIKTSVAPEEAACHRGHDRYRRDIAFFIPLILLPFQILAPTLPKMQLSHWVTSLEAVYWIWLPLCDWLISKCRCRQAPSVLQREMIWILCVNLYICDYVFTAFAYVSESETVCIFVLLCR